MMQRHNRIIIAIWYSSVHVGDGKLEKNELKHAFQKGLAHSKLGNDITNANLLTDVLFTKAKEGCHNNRLETDFSSPDSITFEELNALLQQNPMIYDNLNIQYVIQSYAIFLVFVFRLALAAYFINWLAWTSL